MNFHNRAVKSVSLSTKGLYRVYSETPATLAVLSALVQVYPFLENSGQALRKIYCALIGNRRMEVGKNTTNMDHIFYSTSRWLKILN